MNEISTVRTAVRVAGHLLADRLRTTRAFHASDVPSSVDAITPAWWSAVLGSNVPGATVVDAQPVGGSSGTHARHRFALTWNDAGQNAALPTAVFTKSLPTLVTRMIGGYNGTARAEGSFYMQIRPHLDIEAPLGYHAAFEPASLAAINVLEDIVVTRDAHFCNYETYVSRQMAEGMVDLLAKLHGATWNHAALHNDWRWVTNFADWYAVGAQKMATHKYTDRALRRAAHLIPDGFEPPRVWPAIEASAPIHRQAPTVLLHSDVHIGNWYQRGDGIMGLYDWQCVTQGHPARDLSYALAAALEPRDRLAWERELMQRYLQRLGEQGVVGLDEDSMWDAYRAQMMHALWMWTITLCHSPLLPAMQSEATSLVMIERIARAISDLNSIDVALDASMGSRRP